MLLLNSIEYNLCSVFFTPVSIYLSLHLKVFEVHIQDLKADENTKAAAKTTQFSFVFEFCHQKYE